jgi:hypothetical protein
MKSNQTGKEQAVRDYVAGLLKQGAQEAEKKGWGLVREIRWPTGEAGKGCIERMYQPDPVIDEMLMMIAESSGPKSGTN